LLIRDEDAQGNAIISSSPSVNSDCIDDKFGLPQEKDMAALDAVLYLTYEGSCEHYSSVRNLQGPDYGLPKLKPVSANRKRCRIQQSLTLLASCRMTSSS
jgi:hypothetical protein